jgi:hypothetical protein
MANATNMRERVMTDLPESGDARCRNGWNEAEANWNDSDMRVAGPQVPGAFV